MIKSYINEFANSCKNTLITNKKGNLLQEDRAFHLIKESIEELRAKSKTLFLAGNGGSSAVVSHASVDLIHGCRIKAYPIVDHSILTAMSNDYGYEEVFRKTLELSASAGDGIIVVSGSGESKNIINAANLMQSRGGLVITYTGFKENNTLRRIGDINFWVPNSDYGKVELAHGVLLHILTDQLKVDRDAYSVQLKAK